MPLDWGKEQVEGGGQAQASRRGRNQGGTGIEVEGMGEQAAGHWDAHGTAAGTGTEGQGAGETYSKRVDRGTMGKREGKEQGSDP